MTTEEGMGNTKIKINQNDLYKEEVFSDLKVAAIRQLTPVKPNGEADKARKMLFFGQTQLVTPHGPFPIEFPIEAINLQQAIEKFPVFMEQFMEKLADEAKRIEREEQSRLIVPDTALSKGNIILK